MRFTSLGNLANPVELARFLRTVKHLRPRQVAYGIKYRLLRSDRSRPWAMSSVARTFRTPCLPTPGAPAWDGSGENLAFLRESRRFAGDWKQEGAGRLWQYHLHYMDWIHAPDCDAVAWMRRWIRDNPSREGGTGWEPYPLSRRLFSWCRYYASRGTAPDPDVRASIGIQAGRLAAGLEYHLDANHLLENLLACAFAGFFADVNDARTTASVETAMREIGKELEVQVLPDGGHYELSPMYHASLLERILDLLNAWPVGYRSADRALLAGKAESMLAWLEVMSVAGRFALFNDAAYGMAQDTGPLTEYGGRVIGYTSRPPGPLVHLEHSGYFRAEAGPWTLIFDAGRLGPDHQMGHAHCDMLSFCLWRDGKPVVIHPGTFAYAPGPLREYCRSTAAHNTVTVDGQEQAELWGAHRIGRRGYPIGIEGRESGGPGGPLVELSGAHGGYRHLAGKPTPRRSLRLTSEGLRIEDRVESGRRHDSRSFLHFPPESRLTEDGSGFRIQSTAGTCLVRSNLPLERIDGAYCPEFGLRQPSPGLAARFQTGPCEITIQAEGSGTP